jgi:hypothetical protein
MKNKFTLLFTFFALFALATPALAAPPEAEKVEAKAEDPKEEAKAPAAEEKKDDAKTDEAKADEPAEVKTDEEAVEAADGIYNAVVNRNWALAVALGLTLLVFGLRKMKVLAKVPAKAVPWVTAAMAMVGYVAAALMTPGVAIGGAIMEGLAAGASAVGLWEMLLKHFLGGKKEEPVESGTED